MKKALYIVLGCIGLGLGALGAALPLLPAFPFLLLAAFSFAKSSEKLHNWFLGTKLYKNNLESFVRGRGMTWKTKIRIMIIVTVTMSVGFFMMSRVPIGRIILAAVWIFHILYFVFGIKTIKNTDENPIRKEYVSCRKIQIRGLHCENCARKLEYVFNSAGDIKATVDFQTATATVYLQRPFENARLKEIVSQAGYKADEVWEVA